MNKKGFTLVELLAVVVILAIIAIIAVPLILGVIESSKKGAFKDSVYGLLEAGDIYVASSDINENEVGEAISLKSLNIKNKNQFVSGYLQKLETGEIKAVGISDGNWCATGTRKTLQIEKDCESIDDTPPNPPDLEITTTSSSAKIKANCSGKSEIVKYVFSKDGGKSWTNEQENDTYIYDNLKSNTNYNFAAKCTNKLGLTSLMGNKNEKTNDIKEPTYSLNTTSWATEKILTLTYDDTDIKEPMHVFMINGTVTANTELTSCTMENDEKVTCSGSSVKAGTALTPGTWYQTKNKNVELTYTSIGDVKAKIMDGTNYKETSTYNINNIDNSTPKVPTVTASDNIASGSAHGGSYKINISGSESASGIIYYYGTTNNPTTVGTSITSGVGISSSGTQTYYVKACNGVGKCSGNATYVAKLIKADIFVSQSGNDSTGNGTYSKPYATLNKAVDVATTGKKIYIMPGTYNITTPIDVGNGNSQVGVSDQGKALEIYGDNANTILKYNGALSTLRDGNAIYLNNASSVLRNLVYEYTPGKSNNYSNAIFMWTQGTVKNVFFRITGSTKASFLYYNYPPRDNSIINCTFYFDLGSVSTNHSGHANYTNNATNVGFRGIDAVSSNNVTATWGQSSATTSSLISSSKNVADFKNASVGVFYGENAW